MVVTVCLCACLKKIHWGEKNKPREGCSAQISVCSHMKPGQFYGCAGICQALYNYVVYFLLFTSVSVFIVSLCCAAGANYSGEVLEAVVAGIDLADEV